MGVTKVIHKSRSTEQIQCTQAFSLEENNVTLSFKETNTNVQTVFSYKELHFVPNNCLSLLAGTHSSGVIVVAVYAEHRNGNVQVFILIVNPGEPTTHKQK